MRVLFSSLVPSSSDDSLRAFAKQSLGFSFGSFSDRIENVRLELNELSRTEGEPTHCHLLLDFDGEPVAVATLAENPFVAIEEAADEAASRVSPTAYATPERAHAV